MAAKKKNDGSESPKMHGDEMTANPPGGGRPQANDNQGGPFQQQDPKRRLGHFDTEGEAPLREQINSKDRH